MHKLGKPDYINYPKIVTKSLKILERHGYNNESGNNNKKIHLSYIRYTFWIHNDLSGALDDQRFL